MAKPRTKRSTKGTIRTSKLDELLLDAKRVVRGANALLKLRDELPDQAAAELQVAAVHKPLLQSLKKLDKAFGVS